MNFTKSMLILVSILLMVGGAAMAQTEKPKLYDEEQDVKSDMKEALAIAKKDGKHVLLQIGGNW